RNTTDFAERLKAAQSERKRGDHAFLLPFFAEIARCISSCLTNLVRCERSLRKSLQHSIAEFVDFFICNTEFVCGFHFGAAECFPYFETQREITGGNNVCTTTC